MGSQGVSGHWVMGADMVNHWVADKTDAQTTTTTSSTSTKKSSIFTDKNGNGIVDKDDFDDEKTAKLAVEKGVIGNSWDNVGDKMSTYLNSKNGMKNKTVTRYNSGTKEQYTADLDKSGREIRRTYYKSDGSVDQYVTLEYGKDGKVSSKTYCAPDGTLQEKREYSNDKQTRYSIYNADGKVKEEYKFNTDGKVSEKIEHSYKKIAEGQYYDAKTVTKVS